MSGPVNRFMKISPENDDILAGPKLIESVKNCQAPAGFGWAG